MINTAKRPILDATPARTTLVSLASGISGYRAVPDVLVHEYNSLADPVGSHMPANGTGAGHRKRKGYPWVIVLTTKPGVNAGFPAAKVNAARPRSAVARSPWSSRPRHPSPSDGSGRTSWVPSSARASSCRWTRRPRNGPSVATTVRSAARTAGHEVWRTELVDSLLEAIDGPEALRGLDDDELRALADEIRDVLIDAVSVNGGHLGSNLGAVELTLALHRVFDSPRDAIVWDTGHQATCTSWSPAASTASAASARAAGCRATHRGPSPSTTSSRTATRPPR